MSATGDGNAVESQPIKFKKPQSKKTLRQRREITEEEQDDDKNQNEEVDIL